MGPQCESYQTSQPFNRSQPYNQPRPNQQPLTDEKIKEIVIETLIELNLVPKPEKKKVLTTV
jgi:hypothetical protein